MKKRRLFPFSFFFLFMFYGLLGCGEDEKKIAPGDIPLLIPENQITTSYLQTLTSRGKSLVHFILLGSGSIKIDYWVNEIQGEAFECASSACHYEMTTKTVFSVTPSRDMSTFSGEMDCVMVSNSCRITANGVYTLTVNFEESQ